jgi:hypothetical protein
VFLTFYTHSGPKITNPVLTYQNESQTVLVVLCRLCLCFGASAASRYASTRMSTILVQNRRFTQKVRLRGYGDRRDRLLKLRFQQVQSVIEISLWTKQMRKLWQF